MNFKHFLLLPLTIVALSACNSDDEYLDISQPIIVDFSQSSEGFSYVFSDYPVSTAQQNNEEFYQLAAEYKFLPSPVDASNAWWLHGNNHSDDLLMIIKGQIQNLKSNTLYQVEITADITTDVPSNCFGIGGAPGESVYIKLGASTQEPKNEILNDFYRLNIDLGNQSNSGTQGQSVGDIANGIDCMNEQTYVKKTLSTISAIDVMTDDNGSFWIIAGSDSGFEGLTYYYINKLVLNITE